MYGNMELAVKLRALLTTALSEGKQPQINET
jgi:hypothetical protein